MRCPECQASAAATDAHGWVVCAECGLVIAMAGRLERDCAVLTHNSPISEAAPLGSSIDARGFENGETVRQIRRADRYARRASTSTHDAGCQFMALRAALDLRIPLVAFMGRYDRISKKTRGISAKNLAAIVFYEVAHEYRCHVVLHEFLAAAGLTKVQYFTLSSRLRMVHVLNGNRHSAEALVDQTLQTISRTCHALGLSHRVLAYASKVAQTRRLSNIARNKAGVALYAAYLHFKGTTEIGSPKLTLKDLFACLGVSSSTIFDAWNRVKATAKIGRRAAFETQLEDAVEVSFTSFISPRPPIRAGRLCRFLSTLSFRRRSLSFPFRFLRPACPSGLSPREIYRWWESQGSPPQGSVPLGRRGGGRMSSQRALGSVSSRLFNTKPRATLK